MRIRRYLVKWIFSSVFYEIEDDEYEGKGDKYVNRSSDMEINTTEDNVK